MERYLIMARKFGRMLASEGFQCVNGGGRGMMRELCEGARELDGAVDCVALGEQALHSAFTSRVAHERLAPRQMDLITRGDAFVTLPGGFGSLAEIAQVLACMALKEVDNQIPVITVGREWRYLHLLLEDMGANGVLTQSLPPNVMTVPTIELAIAELLRLRTSSEPRSA